jgi:signal transduction histidine kinase
VKDLLGLLKSHGIEIAAAWAGLVSQIPASHYTALALEEIRSSTNKGVDAIVELLETDSERGIELYLRDLSVMRLDQGFEIREVIQALMLLRRAVLPYLFTVFPLDASETYQAHLDLDTCMRYMVGRFGHLYSRAMNQSLEVQQQQAHDLAEENANLYRETHQRLEESLSLQRVTSALLQKRSLNEVLDVVCCEALGLINAEGSAVYLLESDGWLRSAHQAGSGLPTYDTMPLNDSFTGLAVRTGKPMYTNDPVNEPLWYGRIADPAYVWQISSLLAAPLLVKEIAIGALVVTSKHGSFDNNDQRILQIFADQAAIAIENARLSSEVERIAIIEERNRLARELHDSVTQSLYGITLYAEAAARRLGANDIEGVSDNLQDVRITSQEALKEMRLLIYELRPPLLEKEGLVAALQARLDMVEGRAGLQTELQVEGDKRLPTGVEEGFYRIAQEALNNVLKHAQARRVRISLSLEEPAASLEVVDDGVGFVMDQALSKGGLGLQGMYERAIQLGGQVAVDSTPGCGTRIRVEAKL